MEQINLKKVKEIVEEFFRKMAFEPIIEVSLAGEIVSVDLETDEPQILISQGGETLAEIQRLLKIIARRQLTEDFRLELDINGYKKKKADYLKEMAKEAADEVALTKKEKELPIMPSYERRVVHLALAQRTDVVSESVGQGLERRIIIRLRP